MDNLCNKVFSFEELLISVNNWGATVYLGEKLKEYDRKTTGRNILLVSHELARTGAPMALYHFANALKKNGDNIFVISPSDGSFRSAITDAGIPLVIYNKVFTKPMVKEWIPLLDAVIVNTIAGVGLINILGNCSVPILWWIHEASISYHKGVMDNLPDYLPRNVRVYCVGERASESLLLRRPQYCAESLLYLTPDTLDSFLLSSHISKSKYTILSIGVLEYRKGQDILVDAYRLLDDENKTKIRLVFVGKRYYDPIWDKINQLRIDYPDNVFYISELSMELIRQLELQADCIVCSSRDDPMPIVITEMMMLSKTVIASEFTGQATLLRKKQCGYIYENNDPLKLADLIAHVVNCPEEQEENRKKAREIYERYFSEKVFEYNARIALQNTIQQNTNESDDSISVIIPSYNGKKDFIRLIPRLKNQKRVNLQEIICIDSGSQDGTPEYAKEEGCTVYSITKEEFSHSYARNLGASKAHSKYILFMTQDALPEDELWLCKMVQPLIQGVAVAASCRQIPREDCDLYGKASGQLHAEYMLFPYGDRILSMPASWDSNNIRKNAQLDDVACIINRHVFSLFKYRGDYAEDLDMGIRLIQSGYHLALMNSAKVIHSHKRPAYYHLRRAIVDNAILNHMLGIPMNDWEADIIINKSITAYLLTQTYIQYILSIGKEYKIDTFKEDLCSKYPQMIETVSHYNSSERKAWVKKKLSFFDDGLVEFVKKMAMISKRYEFDDSLFGDVLYFAVNSILDYLQETSNVITVETQKDFCDALVKRLGTMIGIALTQYSLECHRKEPLSSLIEECRKGI